MDSLEDVISYGNENLVYKRIQQMMRHVDGHKGTIDRGMNLGNTLFLGGVQLTVVVVAIMAANALTGAWDSVMVAVAAIGTQAWFEALQPMIAAVHHGAESKVATSRLIALANEPLPVVEPLEPKPFNPNRDITFTNVSFGYDHAHTIYENLRLNIKQGQSIAIVGASGSGKTTLFNMLERLYDYNGSIHVGDVELKDISYIQIHPTTLYSKENKRKFLISESVRGEGAILLNQKLERFTDELKPRDKVTKAILEEMKKDKSEYEWLDFSTIKLDVKERFPNIYRNLMENNIDPLKDKVPVVPAQHYTMGGIKVDMDSKTSMKNLYAIGEVACTGVHGKNRLASNSLLESVVFGKRAAYSIIDENNISIYNEITDDIFENIADKIILTDEKENKNIIEKRIKEDEFEKNR